MDNPFYKLAPFIQEYIYSHRWTQLRAVQTAACYTIFETDDNLLLSAGTASGKTEAAFFPILSLFDEDPPASVGALYIGPLKALINDQFLRLNDLCEEADIPVWHWHGDVNRSHKDKLIRHPSGILQITPESLEAMLRHRHQDIVRLFGDLRFVVIDEVHSLMRGDRGAQVLCLLERLQRMSGVIPRRIGLSATIGDLDKAGEWLSSGTGRKTQTPKIEARGTRWRISMEYFNMVDTVGFGYKKIVKKDPLAPKSFRLSAPEYLDLTEDPEPPTDIAPADADPGMGYIFEHTAGRKCLVFCNSREECEVVTTTLRHYCDLNNEPDRFLIHHGNLSASLRETAESDMRDESLSLTTCTTATLELGIDIGRLERAFQIDAPFTVSSFLQRMGRTGRRDTPPEMWFVIREEQALPTAPLPQLIPWKLLQAIALVQLYMEERWVEPPNPDHLPYSLLYHQTMSILATSGELRAKELAERVMTLSPFKNVPLEDFRELLLHLIEIDHIQKTAEGGLIVGLAGERVVNSYKFYAVFKEDELFTVRCGSQELGTIVQPPPLGERIALAGHVWINIEIDYKKKLIFVEPVGGTIPAFFGLCPGDINTKILRRMERLLRERDTFPYMRPASLKRLADVRTLVTNAGGLRPLMHLGGEMWALLPWLGTYAFLAAERFLKIKCAKELGITGFESARPYFMQFKMKATAREFWEVTGRMAAEDFDAMELVYPKEVPYFEKYDEYVPEALIRKGFAYDILAVDEMRAYFIGASRPGLPEKSTALDDCS
ncbi:MAG: DEAD/DEAH box helicase [Ruminococcaceae bacterium]|nr:DEAD/DEAH box helicase [Oscillospiraceae bacterium]